jgi:hypothetical protein
MENERLDRIEISDEDEIPDIVETTEEEKRLDEVKTTVEEKRLDEVETTVEEKKVCKEEQKKLGYIEGSYLAKFSDLAKAYDSGKFGRNIARVMDSMIEVYPDKKFIESCVVIFNDAWYLAPEIIQYAWKDLLKVLISQCSSLGETTTKLQKIFSNK